jgi:hypothetical protein
MTTQTENQPGIRERHLLRKRNNPLFSVTEREVSNEALAEARLADGLEMDRFLQEFQALVKRAVELEPNTPSETILEIKEQLDHSYQRVCALPGDQSAIKQAIRQLIEVIMKAVRSGIGNDAYAERQLEEEVIAREAHFELQELALVAALTHADSPVSEEEFVPSLLSEVDENLERCLLLFDEGQLAAISNDAEVFLEKTDPDKQLVDAWRRLALIQDYYRRLLPDTAAN